MNNYPELTPSFRRYTLGSYPVTTKIAANSTQVRFLHGLFRSQLTLVLVYENLTQAEAALIRDHFRDMKSGFYSFQLPAAVWSGQSSTDNIVTNATRWKYGEQVEEDQKSGGLVDLAVSLVSVRF